MLEEAYDLFAGLRLEHQVQQLERGAEPDDHLDPRDLNPLSRRYLRDAFREVPARCRGRLPPSSPGAPDGNHRIARAGPLLPRARQSPRPRPRGVMPTFSVIDFEMTGLDPTVHEIVSFATVTVTGGRVPPCGRPLSDRPPTPDARCSQTFAFTASARATLRGAPALEEVLDDLLEALYRQGPRRPRGPRFSTRGFCARPSKPVRPWPSATRSSIPPPWRLSYATGGTSPRWGARDPSPPTQRCPRPGSRTLPAHSACPSIARTTPTVTRSTTAQVFIALATHLDAYEPQTVGSLERLSKPGVGAPLSKAPLRTGRFTAAERAPLAAAARP